MHAKFLRYLRQTFNSTSPLATEERIRYYLAPDLQGGGAIELDCTDDKLVCAEIPDKSAYRGLAELLAEEGWDRHYFLLGPPDVGRFRNSYELSKIRFPGATRTTILKTLNLKRHWRAVYAPPKDRPFHRKRDEVVWRGAPTGIPFREHNRLTFLRQYFDLRSDIDVGFSLPNNSKLGREPEVLRFAKAKMQPAEMLQYKYVLSLEGNDKDSGLNWKLNSNSVVLMSPPSRSSWLMEEKLQPGVHYIPLKADFSDLQEKLDECRSNQRHCEQVLANARRYMQQFQDTEREAYIERQVLKGYFDRLRPLLGTL